MHVQNRRRLGEWTAVVSRAAERFGTPCYIARWRPVDDALRQLESLRSPVPLRSWFSFKTHPVPSLIERWLLAGRGVEVVSEFELVTARKLGASADTLLVNGVAKHAWLPRHPIPRLHVHLDSLGETRALLPMALRQQWRMGVRCHVPVEGDVRDPRFGGQFGMTDDEAIEALARLGDAGIDVRGVHFHVGQRPQGHDVYERAVEHVAEVCARARFAPRYLDMGGGLPSPSLAGHALAGLKRAIDLAVRTFGALESVWLENGRFVTEASTALAVRVLDIKVRDDSRYLICDGGRTNHALAADHGPHELLVMPERHGKKTLTTVCGPTCMTDDVLARMPLPNDIVEGDVIAWLDAGAYHLPWETRFSHGLCAVVWCDEEAGVVALSRERESPDTWSQPWTFSAA